MRRPSSTAASTRSIRCFCTGITRAANGSINGFNNTLRNLGHIDTSGYDFVIELERNGLGSATSARTGR